jgi:predicted ArsR family transcriptional regulator
LKDLVAKVPLRLNDFPSRITAAANKGPSSISRVLKMVENKPGLKTDDIAKQLKVNAYTVRTSLSRLKSKGEVEQADSAWYLASAAKP